MGEIIIWNWDLKDFGVRVNLPSPIRQVWVPICHVITPIRDLPNPNRQVVPLISHICSYPPHRSHLHTPSLSFTSTTSTIIAEHKVKSSLCISPCHDQELTPSTCIHRVQAYTKYSIHQVQHTPSTAYTKYSIPKIVCLPVMLMITNWPLNVASASSVPPCMIDSLSHLALRAQR